MEEEIEEFDDGFNPMEEDNVYKEKSRLQLVDDDALTPEEEGFMNGYDDADEPEKAEESSDEEW